MRLLVLGGTRFVGRHLAEAALARGYDVTLFHRGRTNPGLFPAAERILGDRAARGVEPWTGLPLWLPTESAGFQKTDNRKAVAAGLSFRLLAETVRDTLAWLEEIGHLPAPAGLQAADSGGRPSCSGSGTQAHDARARIRHHWAARTIRGQTAGSPIG